MVLCYCPAITKMIVEDDNNSNDDDSMCFWDIQYTQCGCDGFGQQNNDKTQQEFDVDVVMMMMTCLLCVCYADESSAT